MYFFKIHAFKCHYTLILTVVALFFAKTKMLTLHLFAWEDYGCNNFLYFQSYLKFGHTTFIEKSSNILNIIYCRIPELEVVLSWKVEIA